MFDFSVLLLKTDFVDPKKYLEYENKPCLKSLRHLT